MINARSKPLILRKCAKCSKEHPATLFNAAGTCVYCQQGEALARQLAAAPRGQAEAQKDDPLRAKRREMQRIRSEKAKALGRVEAAKLEKTALNEAMDAVSAAKQELARRELAKKHLLAFILRFNDKYEAGWVHKDLCDKLEWFSAAVAAKQSPRLMVFMPPRHGKSEIGSRSFPAWHLGNYPDHEIIGCSYGQDLANGFSRKVRDVVKDTSYTAVFPDCAVNKDSQSVEQWLTTAGGGYSAAGVGGPITGKGAHVLTIDDPIKNRTDAESATNREAIWDWYTSTAYTRLAPGGGVLVILTRWHDDDLAGRLLKKQAEGEGDEWVVVEYPAQAISDELFRKKDDPLHAERYDNDALERIKRAVGPRDWQALYQQNPTPDDGDYFEKTMFQWYGPQDIPAYSELNFYTAWDFAIGQKEQNDFSVGITVGVDKNDNTYVVDIQRGHWGTMELVDKVLEVYKTWRPSITGLERGHIEMTLRPFLDARIREERLTSFYIEELNPGKRDKVARARSIQGRMQQGLVFFRKNCNATAALVAEMMRFPNGLHDDGVDAMSWIGQMLSLLVRPRESKAPPKKSWKDKLGKLVKGGGRKSHLAS
ncbi:phage terminase large subunit [Pseudomonas fluorescens]|uniref:phage terminase large subunit n=1 Tax=Pseudomonas fluorescens TaxID=294 RepID=UPI000693834C|nr:phage terminase large subunit [Pseudomonas fluorescens]